MGAPKIIPAGWERHGLFLDPAVAYHLKMLSVGKGKSPSLLANGIFSEYFQRHPITVPKLKK